jgi:toxin ParE1/3/4
MAALTIRWTRQAIADIDHIYDFIAANNAAAARAMVDRIDHAINSLAAHPRIGRAGRIAGSRELVVSGTPYIGCAGERPAVGLRCPNSPL